MHFRISKDTEMTPELLSEYITKHEALVMRKNKPLQEAYENRYKVFGMKKKAGWKPDNRISVNFAKYIVDTFNGFFCGIPIKTESDDQNVAGMLSFLDAYNDQDTNNAELAKLMDIHGSAHEMYYVDEQSELCITYLSPETSFFLVDDSILERPMYFVRYYWDSDNVLRGSWSDKTVVQHFYQNGSFRWDGEATTHFFSDVPATEYVSNDEQMGLFESALPMINAYNKALSEKANDVDYFADAYLKILGVKAEDQDMMHIRSNRVINFEGDIDKLPEVDFLTKPDADSTQEHLLDRLEELIFQVSMVPNINAEDFGATSGVALRYKLQSMSNLFRSKERRFTSGMQHRYKVLFSHPNAGTGENRVSPDDWVKIRYLFTPNYPANVADEAQTAAQLSGIVSHETQLRVLSFVDNPKEELKRIAQEEEQSAASLDIYNDLKLKKQTTETVEEEREE
ncbi:MAG: phage portal protein [Lachnospiraceae bacterium]|nr:phage portal protein [Lachnospiraceae bacterium]